MWHKQLIFLFVALLFSSTIQAEFVIYPQGKTMNVPEPPFKKGCHYNPDNGTLWKYDQDYNESGGCSYSCNDVYGGWYNENYMYVYYENEEVAEYKARSDDDDRRTYKDTFNNIMVGQYQYTLTRGELKDQYYENSGHFRQDNLIKEWEVCFEATEEQPNL